MTQSRPDTATKSQCYHCGDACSNQSISLGEKVFCCSGCKSVFEILNENNLCTYYDLNQNPGIEQKREIRKDKFLFLDNPDIKKKLIQFTNGKQTQLTLYLPQIHCSSCLWLLENIHTLDKGIVSSRVNFPNKEVFICFDEEKTTLRHVVETLTRIGYEPHLSLHEVADKDLRKTDRTRWYKIGVAGFCFGNIMMMSFADYLSFDNSIDHNIKLFFSGASVLLSLPVLFYSSTEFFVGAWQGFKNKFLNVDFPVALALSITFLRSMYEIFSGVGNGYLDSMSGIVFFMLIGRWLQSRTYQTLSFDRDYKSFFPIALNVIKDGIVNPTEIAEVKKGDIIQIHSNEIIPVDTILSKGHAKIDYSFVSGESEPVSVAPGEMIYAGGKQLDGLLELIVVKEVSQSYLTNLWNNPVFNKEDYRKQTIYDSVSKNFTYVVLLIGLAAMGYWYLQSRTDLMWSALTTVLIVACPCALLLSQTYTNGNIIRIFSRNKFYLRSPVVIEKLTHINHIVLDKTGTITQSNASNIKYAGKLLTDDLKLAVASLVKQSSHPVSRLIFDYLNCESILDVVHFKETEGNGIEGWVNEHHIKIGSVNFVGGEYLKEKAGSKSVVYIDGEIYGDFMISNKYRFGVTKLIESLKKRFTLSLLSGDNDSEIQNVETLLGKDSEIYFNRTPQQKLDYILQLQNEHHLNVMMVGDGLNDAGALKQSDIGIAVADTRNNFSPSSDGIIDGTRLAALDQFIQFAVAGKKIIFFSFAFSVIYNIIGLYYAVQGILSPVIAAILMPCSSITIIVLTYGLSEWVSKFYKLNNQ